MLAMNEIDLEFYESKIKLLSADNFRNQAMECDNLDIDLWHTLNSVPWNKKKLIMNSRLKFKKIPFSPQHIFQCYA